MQAKYATKETKPKVERKKKNEGMDMRQFLEKKEGSNSLNGAEVREHFLCKQLIRKNCRMILTMTSAMTVKFKF